MLVELSEKDIRMLLRCTRREIGKLAQRLQQSTFVPAEGRVDANKMSLDKARELHTRLEAALESRQQPFLPAPTTRSLADRHVQGCYKLMDADAPCTCPRSTPAWRQ